MSSEPGLCRLCTNGRTVESRRGSRFWLCELSRTDPRFPRYPRLPVLRCDAFVQKTGTTINPRPGSSDV